MQNIEPYFRWRHLYTAEEDESSPFFGREYSEFEYTHAIYNHVIHPQWDEIGSPTLFIKILFAEYSEGYAIIELLGEWNDCLHNDIMFLKRDIIDHLIQEGINKFILIGENVLNFHASDDSYYEEWFDDIEEGWIAFINFRDHVLKEFQRENIDSYIVTGGELDDMEWERLLPDAFYSKVESQVVKRLDGTTESGYQEL